MNKKASRSRVSSTMKIPINTVELAEVVNQRKDYVLVVEPVTFLEILKKLRL